jgi:hypothetical protein
MTVEGVAAAHDGRILQNDYRDDESDQGKGRHAGSHKKVEMTTAFGAKTSCEQTECAQFDHCIEPRAAV